jgi:hypothetical protein
MKLGFPIIGVLTAAAAWGGSATAGDDSPDPVLGKWVVVEPVRGDVSIAPAQGREFVPLRSERRVRVGSLVDTRQGVVHLTSARGQAGSVQSGDFARGVFRVSQPPAAAGLTVLALKGGRFERCSSGAPAKTAIRRLRAHADGSFRTSGRFAYATVVGTKWAMTDTCSGTLTVVSAGEVIVRDRVRRRSVSVHKGERYLARRPG